MKTKLTVREIVIFGMLGGVMYVSKLLMNSLPNIHLIATFIVALTVVYRAKALFPIYVFALLAGVFEGFGLWWIPYLYIWAILWGIVMLLPRKLPPKAAPFIYSGVAALHGFLYGTLYAPFQALVMHLGFKGMVAWIVAGIPFDITHGISNFICGMLIIPLIKVIRIADKAS